MSPKRKVKKSRILLNEILISRERKGGEQPELEKIEAGDDNATFIKVSKDQ